MNKAINITLRVIVCPLVLLLIGIKYNYHVLKNTYFFLMYGGEWITYAKGDQTTIKEIYEQLKQAPKIK